MNMLIIIIYSTCIQFIIRITDDTSTSKLLIFEHIFKNISRIITVRSICYVVIIIYHNDDILLEVVVLVYDLSQQGEEYMRYICRRVQPLTLS